MSLQLTLGADHYDRDVRAVFAQLPVVLVELLEAGLVLQAEDQDHCVDPAAELQEEEDDGWWSEQVCILTTVTHTHTHTQIRTCASGGPASSRISNKWLCPSTSTSFLYLPPDKDSDNDRQVTQQPVAAWQTEDEATSHSRLQEIRSDASAAWRTRLSGEKPEYICLNDLLFKKHKRCIRPALTQLDTL